MVKNTKNKQNIGKKIFKIIGIIVAGIVGLVILIALSLYIFTIIRNKIDSDKFAKLDITMSELFNRVKTVDSSVSWKYDKYCQEEMAGPWPTGEFDCYLSINTKAEINNVEQLNTYHNQYFPVFDNYGVFKNYEKSDVNNAANFGEYFVTSSYEKEYIQEPTSMRCEYKLNVRQKYENLKFLSLDADYALGTGLYNNEGSLSVDFTCAEHINFELYPKRD